MGARLNADKIYLRAAVLPQRQGPQNLWPTIELRNPTNVAGASATMYVSNLPKLSLLNNDILGQMTKDITITPGITQISSVTTFIAFKLSDPSLEIWVEGQFVVTDPTTENYHLFI